jgi:photosynthetic reaction center H subunit
MQSHYIDVTQVLLYLFWAFFIGLVIYLHREDKREGYPLETDRKGEMLEGFPGLPTPKTFVLGHGAGSVSFPNDRRETRPIAARSLSGHPGTPLEPAGNPMLGAIGPGAYADRADTPDLALDGRPKIVPLRVAKEFFVASHDPNPVGMSVIAGDGAVAGTVCDVWVDRSEPQVRYYEVDVADSGRRALVPSGFVRVDGSNRRIKVRSIYAKHFADVPALARPDQVTLLEEDRISAYYGGGTLYAEPSRAEPLL